jgi:hypothetical protein
MESCILISDIGDTHLEWTCDVEIAGKLFVA